jgi:hypothetical protein
VAEPAVQLDHDPLFVVRDVVEPGAADRRDQLPTAGRQPVRPLDVSQEAQLHRALSPARHVTQRVVQATPAMA